MYILIQITKEPNLLETQNIHWASVIKIVLF